MKRPSDDQRALREFFAAVHAEDRAPSFERLATRTTEARQPRVWLRAAVSAAVLALVVSIAWWAPRLAVPGATALSDEDQLALARELSSWQGPLDFLLETPGSEVFSTTPSFDFTTMTVPPPAGREEAQP